jgi:hypothetical protein
MSGRKQAREEARFMRGDTGVDGQATHEAVDEVEKELGNAKEQLFRSRTWLGREFLTWLLWKSEAASDIIEGVRVVFVDRVTLRGIKGEVSEISLKGKQSPYSQECKHALSNGLLLHTARLKLMSGEREWEATLDAEHLDVRSGKIPQLLSEEEDDRLTERLDLTEQLSTMLDGLVEAFLEVRIRPTWRKKVVPDIQEWMRMAKDSLRLKSA